MTHRLIFILRRRWPVVAALVLVGMAAGVALGGSSGGEQAPTYSSTALISVNQAAANPTEVQQALIEAREGDIAAEVAAEIGGGTTAQAVAGSVSTSFDPDSFVATVAASGATGSNAEDRANAFVEAFVASGNGGASADQQAALDQAVTEREAAAATLDTFLADNAEALAADEPSLELLRERGSLEAAAEATTAEVAELLSRQRPTDVYEVISVSPARAVTPGKLQVFGDLRFRVVLGLLLGLGAAAAVIVMTERANPRIDEPAQAADIVGAPVLAMVPRLLRNRRRSIQRADPADFRGPYAEAFRSLRSHLDFRAAAEQRTDPPRIMVTSATPSEGKSTSTAFLALAFAESERPPVVVGGDLRRPTIHRLFGIDRVPGLTSRSLPGGRDVPLTSIVQRDPVTGVTLVPSGPSVDNVVDINRDLRAITEVAQQSGQIVLLDTAPVRVANDAVDFLPAVDWVVLAVQAGSSTERSVRQTVETLRRNGAVIVGVVMIGGVHAADASRDYYAYYAPESTPRRMRRGERATDTLDISDDELLPADPLVDESERPPVPVA